MGYSLPATMGAAIGNPNKQIICIIGDGALQMNIQELATIKKLNLSIKIFVFDNKGYGMIQQTQDDWLDSNYVASCNDRGLCLPDNIDGIVTGYGIEVSHINNHSELYKLRKTLELKKPMLTVINMNNKMRIKPKLTVGQKLEEIK